MSEKVKKSVEPGAFVEAILADVPAGVNSDALWGRRGLRLYATLGDGRIVEGINLSDLDFGPAREYCKRTPPPLA